MNKIHDLFGWLIVNYYGRFAYVKMIRKMARLKMIILLQALVIAILLIYIVWNGLN